MRKFYLTIKFIFFFLLPAFFMAQKNKTKVFKKDSIALPMSVSLQKNKEALKTTTKTNYLLSALKNTKEDTNRVNILNTLCKELLRTNKNDSAKIYIDNTILLAKKLNFEIGLINGYANLGKFQFQIGKYQDALKTLFNALKLSEKADFKVGVANCRVTISSIFATMGNYPEAIKHIEFSQNIFKEIGDRKELAKCLGHLGMIHNVMKNFDEALKLLSSSLKIKEEIEDTEGIGWSYYYIGVIYLDQTQFQFALKYLLTSLKIMQETNDRRGESIVLSNIAYIYGQQKKYATAIEYCKKSDSIAQSIRANETILANKKYLSEIYELSGNSKLAIEYYKIYSSLRDSLNNSALSKKIVQSEMNYKFEKQIEQQRAEQNKKEAVANEKLKQQKQLTVYVGVVAILLLLLTAFIIISYRRKMKANIIIAKQKEEIGKQEATLAGQQEERKRLAADLHDGLGGTLSAIKLNLEDACSLITPSNPEIEKIVVDLYEACKEVRTISHNLAPPLLYKTSMIEVIQGLINQFNIPGRLQINFDCFQEEELNYLNEEIKHDVYRIIQELINNIIKHAEASIVDIGILIEKNCFNLSIEDNGKGFEESKANTGIGLKNLKSRVQNQKGNIIINSKPGRGTAITITIPI